jgi:putative flippase GtrA
MVIPAATAIASSHLSRGGRSLARSQPVTEFVRFGLVGCLATITHVAVFYATERGLDLHPTLATTVAFFCAVGVSYSLNRSWTFRVAADHARHLPRFVSIALACAVLNATIMHVGVELLGWSPTACLAIIILVLPGLSFGLQRQWGFR